MRIEQALQMKELERNKRNIIKSQEQDKIEGLKLTKKKTSALR